MPSGFQLALKQAEAYEASTSVFMDGSARLLANGAAIGADDTVLDLACGTGLVARHVASILGSSGRLVGVDINAAMLELARRSVDLNVEWVEAPCDALPFDDRTFSHVICQQGFQFFPDAVAAMSEAARVSRTGGVLIATVWATPGQNPYIENQLELLAVLDPALAESVQRATPPHADEFLRSAATAAGYASADITLLEHTVSIPDFEPWFLAQTAGTPWGPALAVLNDAERNEVASEMSVRMSEYATLDGGYSIPFRSYRLEARI